MSADPLKAKGPPKRKPKRRLLLTDPPCRYDPKHEDEARRGQLTPLGVLLYFEWWILENQDKLWEHGVFPIEAVRETRRCLKTEVPDALKELDRGRERQYRDPNGTPESTRERRNRIKGTEEGWYNNDIPF